MKERSNHRLSRVVLVFCSPQLALYTDYSLYHVWFIHINAVDVYSSFFVFSVSELCCNGVCPFVRIFGEFRKISQILAATTAKLMKIDPHCQRQRWNSLNVLFNFVPYVICRIAVDFFASGRPSYTRCCRVLTLALARLSCTCLVCIRYGPLNCLGLP